MEICVTAAITLWLATPVALPRSRRADNAGQELVHRRLLGRQQTLALLALVVTAVAL